MINKSSDRKEMQEKTVTYPLKELHRRITNAATILAFLCAGFMGIAGCFGYYLGKQDAKKEGVKTPCPCAQKTPCPCAQKISSQAIPCNKQAQKIEHTR